MIVLNNIKNNEIFRVLKKYVEVPGVTGFEEKIRNTIKGEIEEYAESVSTDNVGNLIASNENGNGHRIMLAAHMDEVGFFVRKIDRKGYIKIQEIGAVPENMLKGQWVRIHAEKGTIKGTICAYPPHLGQKNELKSKFVDIGAENKEEVEEMGIQLGDPVTVARDITKLNNGFQVIGRCLDDRIGCTILTLLLKTLEKKNLETEIIYVFTVQEERGAEFDRKGSLGARVASKNLQPDIAYIVDSGSCNDLPNIQEEEVEVSLGNGPVLRIIDDYTIMDKGLRSFLEKIGQEEFSPQVFFSKYYTDASTIELQGIPVAPIGIPIRYTHYPGQVASLKDIKNTLKYLEKIIKKTPKYLRKNKN